MGKNISIPFLKNDMQMKYNNLKNIEQQIVNANTRGDVKGLEQAVATWQQTIDSYGFKDYSLQRGTPVYNVLQEQQLVDERGGLYFKPYDEYTIFNADNSAIRLENIGTEPNGFIHAGANSIILLKNQSSFFAIDF